MSLPVVVYVVGKGVRGDEEEGEELSEAGVVGEVGGGDGGGGGGKESRRMACVKAGWKGPPKGECFSRWQGRTWPWVKKVEKNLCVPGVSGRE